MNTPIGPSLQLTLLASEVVVELSVRTLGKIWEHCHGGKRADRKLARMEKQGLVRLAPAQGGLVRIVRLTEAGRLSALGGRDPIRQWNRRWDGKWRVVLFDVPERNKALRARLRRKLRAFGFGYLQNSAWISPDGIESLRSILAGERVDVETLTLLEARPGGGECDQDLVAGAWDFDRLNRHYAAYLDLLRRPPAGSIRTPSRRATWRQWLRHEWSAWQFAVRFDPLLPEVLLPSSYLGRRAWSERMRFLRSLPLTSFEEAGPAS
ncbi:MAG: hypothetical protein ACREIA_11240 [Opitutaceae bacterium]